jgi:hypothetical protein
MGVINATSDPLNMALSRMVFTAIGRLIRGEIYAGLGRAASRVLEAKPGK